MSGARGAGEVRYRGVGSNDEVEARHYGCCVEEGVGAAVEVVTQLEDPVAERDFA